MDWQYDMFQSACDEEMLAGVQSVLERERYWIKGPEIEELESKIAAIVDRDHAIAVNSGTSAIYAALECVGVRGDEVILPSFTYQATPNAVVAAGGQPIFAEIERASHGLDPDDVREKITDRTAAIVPVHPGGDACGLIEDLRAIADEHDLFLLEDAAPSLGATIDGQPLGSFGHAAAFSFAFNKVITTGQGGMVVTDDDDLAAQLYSVRKHGRNPEGAYDSWGMNLAMSSIHAAIGLAQVTRLDDVIDQRERLAGLYDDQLTDLDAIDTPSTPDNRDPAHFLYTIELQSRDVRDALRSHLAERGIPAEIYYEPCHLTEYYAREWDYQSGDLPRTEALSERVLTLPFHLNLSEADIDNITDEIAQFFADG